MLDDYITRKVKFVAEFVGTSTNDWIEVKMQLYRILHFTKQKGFTRRHHNTGKHFPPNEFEQEIIALWKELTGVQLSIKPSMLFNPEKYKPRTLVATERDQLEALKLKGYLIKEDNSCEK